MPVSRLLALLVLASMLLSSCFQQKDPPRILIFSKTAGYRHASISAGHEALKTICRESGMLSDSTEDSGVFTEKNLSRYAAVVFLNTTGDVLNPDQEAAFERYIQAGGGYVGIHAATDTEYGWGWYGGLSGGYFDSHPAIQEAHLKIHDHDHPATRHLKGEEWVRKDEWYNLVNLNPNVNLLLSLDESSYENGKMGDNHPISWYHNYDGGRAFYTGLGHTEESYSEPEFLKHIQGGLKYAVGDNKRLNYSRCRTELRTDPTRFVKTELVNELTEPMEFDMLPDGRILLVERRGAIKIFDPNTGLINIVYKLPVHSEHEDGLMGLALDPNYEKNHWIYLYYSPPGEKPVNNLSRFKYSDDTLHRYSEKVLLEVAVQRDECCHAGGSIEFDGEGFLFLSTGDNTNPFDSKGFAPMDENPGRSAWDAQKSSANTKDLRGKILRIKPLDDGTYTCPADNLFASDTTQGRPEIYVMGCRNPFRISLDKRRKLLFWGEVGPDAGEPDSARGPAGHDEINRARAAGFFGWPYFVGNNKPYSEWDFSKQSSGSFFNPEHPINNSPNNTGAQNLPPAQPAFIWYPYAVSEEFPLLGSGGRNAMAGPVYYVDQYPKATRFPDYFDGKLIIYDWARSWMQVVTLDSLGNFSKLEPFADSIPLSRPMDMFIDKNGSLWVLEYGTQWFAKNPDARISRIDFYGKNRPPNARLVASKTAGAAPFDLAFSVKKTRDPDGGLLEYELDFGDGSKPWTAHFNPDNRSKEPARRDSIFHTYSEPGKYQARLRVKDSEGKTAEHSLTILVGNEPPTVYWDLKGQNRTFYHHGDTLQYALRVQDREDGTLNDGGISPDHITTSIDLLETGFDMTQIAQGHQTAQSVSEYARGKTLVEGSDCKVCHAEDRKINGPSFKSIAARYKDSDFAVRDLSLKVIKGSSGVWGETAMSAHPQLSEEAVGEMIRWILSLGEPEKPKQTLPVEGEYVLALPTPKKPGEKTYPGVYILQASYTDRGANKQAQQAGNETLVLRPAFLQAERADTISEGIQTYRPGKDTVVLKDFKHRSFFAFKKVDLNRVYSISVGVCSGDFLHNFSGGVLELRMDSPSGPVIGSAKVEVDNKPRHMQVKEVLIEVQRGVDTQSLHDLYFVVRNEGNASEHAMAFDWVRFNF